MNNDPHIFCEENTCAQFMAGKPECAAGCCRLLAPAHARESDSGYSAGDIASAQAQGYRDGGAHAAGAGRVPTLAEDEMQALRRFDETASDDNSTDLSDEMLCLLAKKGALGRGNGRGEWVMTEYGWWLLSAAPDPKPAPEADARVGEHAPRGIYVECRKCDQCGHAGINDADHKLAACNECEWHGPSPVEDKCPGCGSEGAMTSACPKCNARYDFVADREIAAHPSPEPTPAEHAPQPAPSDAQPWAAESMRYLAKLLRERGDDLSTDAASWLERLAPSDAPASPQAMACTLDRMSQDYDTTGRVAEAAALRMAAMLVRREREGEPASPQAAQGDTVTIDAHWLQNIASAAALLEQSESFLDQREGAALRKLLASAKPASAQGDVEALFAQIEDLPEIIAEVKRRLASAQPATADEELICCDVQVAPGTIFRSGVHLSTVIAGIRARSGWDGAPFKLERPAISQPATARPAGDAEFKVGDRVEWVSEHGESGVPHEAIISAVAAAPTYSLRLQHGDCVHGVRASSLTRLTGGSHEQ